MLTGLVVGPGPWASRVGKDDVQAGTTALFWALALEGGGRWRDQAASAVAVPLLSLSSPRSIRG